MVYQPDTRYYPPLCEQRAAKPTHVETDKSNGEMLAFLLDDDHVSPLSSFFGFLIDMQRQVDAGMALTDNQQQAVIRAYLRHKPAEGQATCLNAPATR